MKRDMDLVRRILLALEQHESGFAPRDLKVEGYTEEQIGYHVYIMMEGELLKGANTTVRGSNSPEAMASCLTWSGHEFLDAAREDGRWNEAKSLLDTVGGAALAVWQTVLAKLVLKSLGME